MGVKKSSEKMVAISFRPLSAEMLDTLFVWSGVYVLDLIPISETHGSLRQNDLIMIEILIQTASMVSLLT